MTTTRIAGHCFDPRQARSVRQTARIYTYARRIRQIATDAQVGPAEPVVPRVSEPRSLVPATPRVPPRLSTSV